MKIKIMRPGKIVDDAGKSIEITPENLPAIAEKYNKSEDIAKVYFGTPENYFKTCVGTVTQLEVLECVLYAELELYAPFIQKVVTDGSLTLGVGIGSDCGLYYINFIETQQIDTVKMTVNVMSEGCVE